LIHEDKELEKATLVVVVVVVVIVTALQFSAAKSDLLPIISRMDCRHKANYKQNLFTSITTYYRM